MPRATALCSARTCVNATGGGGRGGSGGGSAARMSAAAEVVAVAARALPRRPEYNTLTHSGINAPMPPGQRPPPPPPPHGGGPIGCGTAQPPPLGRVVGGWGRGGGGNRKDFDPRPLSTRNTLLVLFYFGASCTTAQTQPSATSDLQIRRIFFGQDIPGMSILSALCCRRHSVKKSHCSSPSSTIFDEMDRHRFLLCRAWRGKLQ